MSFGKRIEAGVKGNGLLIGLLAGSLLLAFGLLYLAGLERLKSSAETLRTVAQLIVSALVVPVLLKLWFWSGIHSLLLGSLSVQKTLHGLGIKALLPDPQYNWPEILPANSGSRFILIGVAAQSLNVDGIRKCVEQISKSKKSDIIICIRDPSTYERLFAPRELLIGQVQDVRNFVKSLEAGKHPTARIRMGWVSFDLKYTLVLGSHYGVYVPHPANQTTNKSPTMPRIVFSCDGDLYSHFLQPDVDYVISQMKDLYDTPAEAAYAAGATS